MTEKMTRLNKSDRSNKSDIDILRRLTETDGISGREEDVRNFILEEIKPYCDRIELDAMGNMLCFKNMDKKGRCLLLSAHMDEVGFIVTKIGEDGYLSFESVGGIDPKILLSSRVAVNGNLGVISAKAVHLSTKEEREAPIPENKLFIDIGAKNKEEAEKYVTVGDSVSFKSDFVRFGEGRIKAKALDDRVGCAVLIKMLKKKSDLPLICTFVTQEEVGLRGAKAACFEILNRDVKTLKCVKNIFGAANATDGGNALSIKKSEDGDGIAAMTDTAAMSNMPDIKTYDIKIPDLAVVIEGTTCNDLSGVSEEDRVTKMGGGAAISVMDGASCANEEIVKMLIKTADCNDILWQYKAQTRGGNDAGAIAVSGGGIKCASVSVPLRYIHSPSSVMDERDYRAVSDLIEKFIERLEEK